MTINSGQNRTLRVVILGAPRSGKSAVIVRYLTKRYIGEYSSSKDFLYQHSIDFDDIKTDIEIMDTSNRNDTESLYEHITWADAFVIVYSICEKQSFLQARYLLETIAMLRAQKRSPIILLGNKRDLEHIREVAVDDGQEMSLLWQCQFYEVSAAESYIGVSLAFQSLIREARSAQLPSKILAPMRRKTSPAVIGKMFGMVFGKNGSKSNSNRANKKRPSLSI
ncbi:ras-related and estrogen-regulated growth inhibitor-like protein [Brevipalpus obovatus]|uniref:ras-related and estrogen-regulated growth inhibitor-like protein n=1 Tax=Brevipalpus obovatus TaxID=246614 RepID=UPI003D9EBB5E